MKSKINNLWRIIWIVGIYLILTIILYLVVIYKIKWEYKDVNTYLYLYDCNGNLCSTSVARTDYYSKVVCNESNCPYIYSINDSNNVILKDANGAWIYNYIENKIINNIYVDYRYIGNDNYVVTDQNGKQGIINTYGDVIVSCKYDYIKEFKNELISYKNDNIYGIDTINGESRVSAIYDDIVLINDKMYAGKQDSVFRIYAYTDLEPYGKNTYNYVYSYKNTILVFYDNKIDILNEKLDSTLIMKINSFYEYKIEKERASLNISVDDDYICFKVYSDEHNYTKYIYSVSKKKLL